MPSAPEFPSLEPLIGYSGPWKLAFDQIVEQHAADLVGLLYAPITAIDRGATRDDVPDRANSSMAQDHKRVERKRAAVTDDQRVDFDF